MIPVVEIVQENPHVKTFFFEHTLASKAGQFVMVWIPGVDQKPYSISYDTGDRFGLTIFAVGPHSKAMFDLQVGDRVGVTGPYGNPFTLQPDTHYITVAGGYGAGPLGTLAEQAVELGCTVDFLVGARSEDLLLFQERAEKLNNCTLHVSTDDGSKGHKGYITDILRALLEEKTSKPILVATCGPEPMEKAVLDLCNTHDVECELSIERYMKCGYAICGQCCVDPLGIPMCTVGPVIKREIANKLTEFGSYHRDKSGKKHSY